MAVAVTTDEHYVGVGGVGIVLEIKKLDGSPATVDGIPVWSSSDDTVMSARGVSADGMRADSIEFLTAGSAKMVITADADMGAGVVPLVGETEMHDVTVGTSGRAATIAIQLGPLTPKA